MLVVVILAVIAVTAWQLLSRQQHSMIAGRPLSYPQTHLHTVVVSPRPGVVYLGTHYGIFTSSDGGRSWPQSQGDLNTNMITAIAVSPTKPNLLAVLAVPTSGLGQRMGIYISADAGKSWHFTLPDHLPASAYPYTIQGGSGVNGRFYVFFSYAGWFETQDLGQHWYAITSGQLASIQTPSLLTDPRDPDHLLMGGDLGLFETRDDGQSWQRISAVKGAVVSLSATTPAGSASRTILCATDQGLYRWREGQQQITRLSGLPASTSPTRLLLSADGSALYALFGSDLWFSNDQGMAWVHRWHFGRGDLVALVIDPANPRRLLAGFFAPGLVLKSDDGGSSWQTLTA
jgi:photosystem II stability/assembly factor-like uncharacterized protein